MIQSEQSSSAVYVLAPLQVAQYIVLLVFNQPQNVMSLRKVSCVIFTGAVGITPASIAESGLMQ